MYRYWTLDNVHSLNFTEVILRLRSSKTFLVFPNWLLQLSVLWYSEISDKSSPTHPECSCSNCCPGSKIPTHHCYSEISSLA